MATKADSRNLTRKQLVDLLTKVGSAGIAAIQTGRRALLIEQDERNAEKAERRKAVRDAQKIRKTEQ